MLKIVVPVSVIAVVVLLPLLFIVSDVASAAQKPPIPKTNGTFTATYTARVLCPSGERTMNLTLVYRGKKLTEIYLGGVRIPPAAFRYPHELSYIGELLLDLDMIYKVDNGTVGGFGGLVKKRHSGLVSLANSPYKATSVLSILTSFNYTYLEIKGLGFVKNLTINGLFLDFDEESGVPYAFQLSILHNVARQICDFSYMFIYAYLTKVK